MVFPRGGRGGEDDKRCNRQAYNPGNSNDWEQVAYARAKLGTKLDDVAYFWRKFAALSCENKAQKEGINGPTVR